MTIFKDLSYSTPIGLSLIQELTNHAFKLNQCIKYGILYLSKVHVNQDMNEYIKY